MSDKPRIYIISGVTEYEGSDILGATLDENEAKYLVEMLTKYNNPFNDRHGKQNYEWKRIPGQDLRYGYDYIEYEEVEDDYFIECIRKLKSET